MKIDDLRKRISELVTCFEFEYEGKCGGVDPIRADKFIIFYNEKTMEVNSVDKVFSTPFINGKTIKNVLEDLEIISV